MGRVHHGGTGVWVHVTNELSARLLNGKMSLQQILSALAAQAGRNERSPGCFPQMCGVFMCLYRI